MKIYPKNSGGMGPGVGGKKHIKAERAKNTSKEVLVGLMKSTADGRAFRLSK